MRIPICFSPRKNFVRAAQRSAKFLVVFLIIFSQLFTTVGWVIADELLTPTPTPSIPSLPYPFKGTFDQTLKFGEKEVDPSLPPLHNGIDFATPEGIEILAVDDGEVKIAGDGDFGITIAIDHPWGRSVYGHLKEVKVNEGKKVSKGEVIALSGNSGTSTGPHLHFGIKPKNADLTNDTFGFIDPEPYLESRIKNKESSEATSSAQLPWEAAAQASLDKFLTQKKESTPSATPEATSSASLSDGQTLSTAPTASASAVLGVSTPSLEDVSQNNEFLYNYKFDLQNGQSAHFYDKAQKRAGFAIADKDYNYKLRFFLKESSNSAQPKVTGNKLEYPVEISGIPMNLSYEISPDRVKEEFIIAENPFTDNRELITNNSLSIPFDLQNEGLKLEKDGDEYILKSADGSVYWKILKPTVTDATGQSGGINLNIENGTATLEVDTNFLKTASYPVTIDPTVVVSISNNTAATGYSTQRHLVRTSDGTLHAFIQNGTNTTNQCSAGGLWWLNSTDSGATWNCGGQVSSDTSNLMYASATVDTDNNIYVVYSMATTGAGTAKDVFYKKLTKGVGSTWTLEDAQTVLDASSSIGYSYATIEAEGATRLWLATRYYDGTNYQISVYYSNGLSAAPTWTVSQTTLDTANTTSNIHYPVIVRSGTKIGIIYTYSTISYWRYRSDNDGLTSWAAESYVDAYRVNSAVTDSSGNIFVPTVTGQVIRFVYYNGSTWSPPATITATAAQDGPTSLSTDGSNVWLFYLETSGLSSGTSPGRKLVYKQVTAPFATANVGAAVDVVSYHGIFDKYWSYVSSAYTNDTTDAGDTDTTNTADSGTGNDVQIVTASGDIAYFGKSTTFDAVSWDLSTNGVGGTITWEYCSALVNPGVDDSCNTWSTLTFTASSNTNLTTDGYGAFTVPGDWVANKVNSEDTVYYYIRARATANFTTTPVGVEMVSIPQINYPAFIPAPASNTIYGIWTENATSPTKIRTGSVSVTAATTPAATAEISPAVAAYSSATTATQASTQRHLVRTSDGTLHAFIQAGTNLACGGDGGSNNIGLNWLYSTDSGSTWTCGGQLSSNTSTLFYADARADSSDNIYVVYSTATTGAGTAADVFYRKLTKGAGSTWTLGSAQTVLDGTASVGYSYATIELEGSTRLWMATRYFDGTNYQVSAYYSDGLSASPTWTVSQATLDTANATNNLHYPSIVRFGSKIGVLYTTTTGIYWRYRSDSDDLTTWGSSAQINNNSYIVSFSALGDTSGNAYFALNQGAIILFTYFNGSTWSSAATVSSSAANAVFTSISLDNASTPNVYVVYGETTGLSSGLSGSRKLVYKKGVSPYATANFDTNSTAIISQHGTFDKVWQYVDSGAVYTDDTTDAGNTTSADVAMVSAVGDIMYFGKTAKFDALSYDLSTNGAGGQVVWEYYNGSSWMPLVDYHAVSNSTFAADGYITFIPHSDWATIAVNGEGTAYYYVRARTTTAYTTAPVGVEMADIPQINWASLATDTSGLYGIWTENAGGPTRVRYSTIASFNATPSDPSSLGGSTVVDGSWGTDTTPDLTFTLADSDGSDTLKYQIQIDDSSDFGSAVVDYTSALAAAGSRTFTVGQAAGSGSYTTGSEGQTLSSNTSYYWRVRATDNGNATSGWSTANSGGIAFKVDTTAPSTVSSLASSSHTASTWSADNTIDVSWTAATDTGGSGVTGYSYTFDTTADTTPDTTSDGASTSVTSSALSDGSGIYFHVRARDSVANWGSASHLGPFYVDTTGPAAPGAPTTSTPTTDTTPTWSFTASSDSGSGLSSTDTYTVEWCTDSGFSGCSSNTSTTTTNSFTHSTALTDGTWYFRVRAKDTLGSYSSYSSSGSVVIDTTSPNDIDLQSPGDNSFTKDTRPTFKWKAASTGDATSGLSKYKFHVDNGTGGDIDIDDIPVSRTSDYETDKYVAQYSGFDDSDNTNNYLTLYTKSSSSWSSDANDGKLREGKRSWQITAVDGSGNTKSGSRTLYVDFTSPTLSETSVDNLTEEDGYLIVTSTKPKVSGKISDNLAYDKLEFAFAKEVYLLGFRISTTNTTITKTLDNTSNAASLSFSFDTPQEIDYGKYTLTLTVIDKAGNRSEGKTFKLHLLSEEKAKQLLAQKDDKDKLKELKEKAKISLPELEKQAKLKKVKEAAELEKLLSGIRLPLQSWTTAFLQKRRELKNFALNLLQNTGHFLAQNFSQVAGTYQQLTVVFFTASNSTASMIAQINNSLTDNSARSGKTIRERIKNQQRLNIEPIGQTISAFKQANTFIVSLSQHTDARLKTEIAQSQKTTVRLLGDTSAQALKTVKQTGGNMAGEIITLNQTVSETMKQSRKELRGRIAQVQKDSEISIISTIRTAAKETIKSSETAYNTALTIQQTAVSLRKQITEGAQNNITALSAGTLTVISQAGKQIAKAGSQAVSQITHTTTALTAAGQNLSSNTIRTSENLTKTVRGTALNIGTAVSKTNQQLAQTVQKSEKQFTDSLSQKQGQISKTITKTINQTGRQAASLNHTISSTLISSQTELRNEINQAQKASSAELKRTGKGITLVYQSIKKPIDDTGDFFQRVQAGADTFAAIVFDNNPTRIADVTIEEIGKDYAVVSWKTNHFAWGKVNYGSDLTYGNEVLLEKREKYHQAKLTDLKPGERYYFEVMSQNKNYAYDAYYSFETPK